MSCGRIADDAADVEPQLEKPKLVKEPRCSNSKCSSGGAVDVVVRNAAFCKACFLAQMTNKFTQGIKHARERCRPAKGSTEAGSLMIAYSGGPASTALLHFIRRRNEHFEERSAASARYTAEFSRIEVVRISLGSADPKSFEYDEACRLFVRKLGFKLRIIPLDDLYCDQSNPVEVTLRDPNLPVASSPQPSTSTTPLQRLLAPLSPTSRAAMIDQLTSTLLIRLARSHGHTVLLRGESTTRVAIRTLSGVALGRGWGLGEEVKAEVEEDGLLISRPLSLVSLPEILHYLSFNSLVPPSGVPTLPTSLEDAPTTRRTDIPALLEDFILGLDSSFPMTSATVARTAEKLRARGGTADGACVLCGLPADPDAEEWRHAIAVTPAAASTITNGKTPTDSSLLPLACYACLAVLRDVRPAALKDPREAVVPLPGHAAEAIKNRRKHASHAETNGINGHASEEQDLRRQVEDFLLE